MKTKQLLAGWKEIRLGEIVKLMGGYAFKSSEFVNEGVPIIRIANFNNNFVDSSKSVRYPIQGLEDYQDYRLKENDLLIAMSGATTGKIGIVSKECIPCLLNQRVGKFNIFDKNILYWKFLLFIIKSKSFQKEVYEIASGCAQPNISGKQIESIKILLPPLPIQKAIVQILEQAEQLKQKRKQADKLMDNYLKSVFSEMFFEKGFEEVEINKGILKTENKNPEKEFPEDYFDYIDIASIDSKTKKIIETKKILGKDAPSRAKQLIKMNDILVSTVRPNLNAVSLVSNKLNNQICSTGYCILRADNKIFIPEYLFFTSQTYSFVNSLVNKTKGANYPAVSNKNIKSLKIPLPPLHLQQTFASIVKQVEKIKEAQKKSKKEIDDLFNALMQKAFRGEIE